jgi:hypothetical protein
VGVDTPLFYAVGWVYATNWTPVIASQVRITVNFCEWLFIGEIKVTGRNRQPGGYPAMDNPISTMQ